MTNPSGVRAICLDHEVEVLSHGALNGAVSAYSDVPSVMKLVFYAPILELNCHKMNGLAAGLEFAVALEIRLSHFTRMARGLVLHAGIF